MGGKKEARWPALALEGSYRASEATGDGTGLGYAIDGLLPATGASVWFGDGSVGKTQLLLWMAAHLAAPAEAGVTSWLGRTINRRGHVLVLSAEDLRGHLMLRLDSILRAMRADRHELDRDALLRRIHLLPFLSLSQDEFPATSPSLYRSHGFARWEPSDTLDQIMAFIGAWNGADGRAVEDRIIGVVLDSAVSMAGFELTNTEATTQLLFHINRVSDRQQLFWAIIGHTSKAVRVSAEDPDGGAVGRLRGSAMWSTTPRTVVEVRTARFNEDIQPILQAHPATPRRDVVFVRVVKANSQHPDLHRRTLLRQTDGAFQDLTDRFAGHAFAPAADDAAQRAAIIALIREVSGGERGAVFRRSDLQAAFEARQASTPALVGIGSDAAGRDATRSNLAGWLRRLIEDGVIENDARRGFCRVLDLGSPGQPGANDDEASDDTAA